jgi:energy-coupling factor transporter ATP-binding protein EcfA2
MKWRKSITLKRIRVQKLFGLYDYEIPAKEGGKNIEKILIIYGDNGSGKTTLLRLIFHLLASEKKEGHKTFVSKTKFKSIEIDFSNNYQIKVTRMTDSLLGTFRMELRENRKKLAETEFVADSKNVVTTGMPKEDENDKFLDTLAQFRLTLYLLADDRTVRVSSPVSRYKHRYRIYPLEEARRLRYLEEEESIELDPQQFSTRLLEDSIRRLRGWIRNCVMDGSKKGESDVNEIFAQIVENIATKESKDQRKKATTRDYLIDRITWIAQRNKKFSILGLTPAFNSKKLLDSIGKVSTDKFRNITPIIVPYLDSFEAKLDALQSIQTRIDKFINTINSFMVNKTMSFHTISGFLIRAKNGEDITPEMLSSGEKHLLLLFCNAMTALDTQSIFIIDEPEISLNVKWQRNLISSLLDCAENSPTQFIFASHSMEILAQHMDKVVKLEHRIK